MPDQVEFLDLEDLLGIVELLQFGPVVDVGLLEAAAARARSAAFGRDHYPTLPLKAAALLDSVVRNHALMDGNKRLGWLATVVFLDINGQRSGVSDDEAFELVMEVASTHPSLDDIARRLRVRARR